MARTRQSRTPVSRGTPPDVAVLLPAASAGGRHRVGAFAPGVVYRVPVPEALRLIVTKHFQAADEHAHETLRAFAAQFNVAAPSGTVSPSQAGGQGGGTLNPEQE